MKNFKLFLFFFCLALQISAQPGIEWAVALGGSKADFAAGAGADGMSRGRFASLAPAA